MFQIFFFVYVWKLQPLIEKSQPPLSQQPPSKSWGPVKPPFWKNWLEVQPFLQQKGGGGGAQYVLAMASIVINIILIVTV